MEDFQVSQITLENGEKHKSDNRKTWKGGYILKFQLFL